jgi:hypothetical protein
MLILQVAIAWKGPELNSKTTWEIGRVGVEDGYHQVA